MLKFGFGSAGKNHKPDRPPPRLSQGGSEVPEAHPLVPLVADGDAAVPVGEPAGRGIRPRAFSWREGDRGN